MLVSFCYLPALGTNSRMTLRFSTGTKFNTSFTLTKFDSRTQRTEKV